MKTNKKYNVAYENLIDLADDYGLSLGETARIECIDYYEVEGLITYEKETEVENMTDEEAINLYCTIFSNK